MSNATLFRLSILLVVTFSTKSNPIRLFTKLTHICSKSTNVTGCIEEISNTRLAFLKSKFRVSSSFFEADLYGATKGWYFADISIGTPPVSQLVLMDNGSDLLWVQCQPCIACQQHNGKDAIFVPAESSTYRRLSCFDPLCISPPERKCDTNNECEFSVAYADSTFATGYLSYESITFTISGSEVSIPKVVFGCAFDDNDNDEETNGILGLGADKLSLVSQLGSNAYSYCLGNVMETEYEHTKLVIGDVSIIQGKSTPFEIHESHYYVHMEGISVGEKRLDIDSTTFQRNNMRGGVLIDSGTVYTFLRRNAFNQLRNEIQSWARRLELKGTNIRKEPNRLCYVGSMIDKLRYGFPDVTFHFRGGADLVLEPQSIFTHVNHGKGFCLAVHKSEDYGMDFSIVGLLAQQNHNIGYDLSENKVSFQMIDCEELFPDD